jgi:hypothetical protein
VLKTATQRLLDWPNSTDYACRLAVEFPFYWLAAVDVLSSSAVATIVPFGDSWVDGRCSTNDDGVVRSDLYQRWTDVLAARLASELPNEPRAVVNAGIAATGSSPGVATVPQRWRGSTEMCWNVQVPLMCSSSKA